MSRCFPSAGIVPDRGKYPDGKGQQHERQGERGDHQRGDFGSRYRFVKLCRISGQLAFLGSSGAGADYEMLSIEVGIPNLSVLLILPVSSYS